MFTPKSIVFSMILSFFLLGFTNSNNNPENKVYENFSLYNFNHELHHLKDFSDKKGIIIIFVSTQCPVSNAYNSRMASLFDKYGSEFSFIGINSNKKEDVAEIKKHAADNKLNFVILKDSSNIIADRFEASFTPEVYVLNNKLNLLYHGRIDDSRREDKVEIHDLSNVLNEIKAGKEVSVKETKAFGCSIKRIGK